MPSSSTSGTKEPPSAPAVPIFIFRGHAAAIHALLFFALNAFLVSGDSDGWLVIWSLTSKRPVAVWKGHEGGVMAIRDWGNERLITHGRDHQLRVWRLSATDFDVMDTKLPVDGADAKQNRQPWLLHSMAMNAMNFCAFAMCYASAEVHQMTEDRGVGLQPQKRRKLPEEWGASLDGDGQIPDLSGHRDGSSVEEVLTSDRDSPTTADLEDNVCTDRPNDGLPTEPTELDTATPNQILIAAPNGLDQGGIDIFQLPSEHRLSRLPSDKDTKTGMVMALRIFQQPSSVNLLLISGYEDGSTMVHIRSPPSISPTPFQQWHWHKLQHSRPHTQPILSLDVHPDKTHYYTSSADAIVSKICISVPGRYQTPKSSPATPTAQHDPSPTTTSSNTKHAGQQDLTVRSDGKIFATAGWDRKVRVYGCRTTREVACLKWHREGCYAVAFAGVDTVGRSDGLKKGGGDATGMDRSDGCGDAVLVLEKPIGKMVGVRRAGQSALERIKQARSDKARKTHWLAAGGKDGKVSLWDIY